LLPGFEQWTVAPKDRVLARPPDLANRPERGGTIVADEVGLGKTFIAGEIIRVYRSNRQRFAAHLPGAVTRHDLEEVPPPL
jgi:hypothetical protein